MRLRIRFSRSVLRPSLHLLFPLLLALHWPVDTSFAAGKDKAAPKITKKKEKKSNAGLPQLKKKLKKLVKGRRAKFRERAKLQVAVRDLESGEVLYQSKSKESLNLASVTKMVTAGAALHYLGPDFSFQTKLFVLGQSGESAKSIILQTGGDPVLKEADLEALALAVRRHGIRKAKSVEIVLGALGPARFPPEFETKKTDASYRAPVGDFNLNQNRILIHIKPSNILGKAPRVSLTPSASGIKIINRAKTKAGRADRIGVAVKWSKAGLPAITITGSIGAKRRPGVTGVRLNRHPERWAAETFRTLLKRSGVKGPASSKFVGAVPENAQRITKHQSAPLSEIVRHTLQHSDNQAAEALLLKLGEREGGDVNHAISRVQAWLKALDISEEKLTIRNGSGLYGASAGSALAVTKMLVEIYQNSSIAPDFLAGLAAPGRPGTMSKRLKHLPRGSIRAKTGTLNEVSTLCGYALSEKRKTAFCVIANDIRKGNLGAAREFQDRVAEALTR